MLVPFIPRLTIFSSKISKMLDATRAEDEEYRATLAAAKAEAAAAEVRLANSTPFGSTLRNANPQTTGYEDGFVGKCVINDPHTALRFAEEEYVTQQLPPERLVYWVDGSSSTSNSVIGDEFYSSCALVCRDLSQAELAWECRYKIFPGKLTSVEAECEAVLMTLHNVVELCQGSTKEDRLPSSVALYCDSQNAITTISKYRHSKTMIMRRDLPVLPFLKEIAELSRELKVDFNLNLELRWIKKKTVAGHRHADALARKSRRDADSGVHLVGEQDPCGAASVMHFGDSIRFSKKPAAGDTI
ncbi:uncharacterized protein K452DRAFT_334486 [Aplosporella prunicola CBS 121167]|uniref:RNase H type-1 domain-containing protein n=1 Tax=Aplosporella prunicola CBS 121167 TaxID=1176127 RepID=A0A6A6BCG8_9PEZI|nr:uncharacterized protein K452DRAFT_334486 [Aplosporella prunicola CBS 121167]KAF2140965.1 hypothetical protein K452DRAFT_334486 [Aplosporella prunicola CBS 121167]